MMNWIENILNDSPVIQGGLTLMVAGWVGYQARALPQRVAAVVRSWFTRVVEVRDNHPLYDAWLEMLTEGALRPGGPRILEVRTAADEHEERAASAGFTAGVNSFWARVCGKICRAAVHREDGGPQQFNQNMRFAIRVEVLFASREDLASMMRAAKVRANVMEDCQLVDLCSKYGARNTTTLPKRVPDTLCLPEGLFDRIHNRLEEFVEHREYYERIGVPWRFGIMLYGEPGTGKTSIAHALASSMGMRLAVIPLSDLRSDEELIEAFSAVRAKSITLIEDVDSAFNHRKAEEADGITFSGLLNCIDGVIAPSNGRILVMSTNHLDRLDPALVRPGRVDLKLKIPLLTQQAATGYVDRLFSHLPIRHEIVRNVMSESKPTPAVLINRLMSEDWIGGCPRLAKPPISESRSRSAVWSGTRPLVSRDS